MAESKEVTLTNYLDGIRRDVGPVARGGWYSPEGDTLYFYNESADHYRQRVDDALTVYRAETNHRIIGVQIKCVSKLPTHDAAAVMVREYGTFSVVTLLLATLRQRAAPEEIQNADPIKVKPYFDAIEAFDQQASAEDFEYAGR